MTKKLSIMILFVFVMILLFSDLALSSSQNGTVLVLNLNMEIDPGSDQFISSDLIYAANAGYHTVIIQMNTPGGLLQSMVNIVYNIQSAEQSGVRIYTFVPPGGLAASAGSYIAMATDGIYMGNGTEIGPSTPIVVGGSQLQQNHTENAMLALMRGLASAQNRNVTAVTSMVLNNTAYSSIDALKLNVIEGIANNIQEVLNYIGMPNAALVYRNASVYDQFLSFMSNPVVDGLFIMLGIIAILLDLYHATILLTVLGVIFIGLGLYGSQLIGASVLAILFFIIAAALIILELKTGHGILLLAGVGMSVFGTWLLAYQVPYSPSPFGDVEVAFMVLMVVVGVIAAIYLNKIRVAIKKKPETGWEAIRGNVGTVIKTIEPKGEIRMEGIIWEARSKTLEKIEVGEKVKVLDREGMILVVEKVKENVK